jgi:hypothetical protein
MRKREKIPMSTAEVPDVYMDEKLQRTIPQDDFEQG